jgi:hypothetical protein
MDKKDTKILDKRESLFVSAVARAIAVANGHSHPDDYARAVADAYLEPGDVAEARRDDAQGRE